MERLWHLTQTPAEHLRWDLRFTDIEYLPRPNEDEPQRFLYATRIGFGLAIRGHGETAGEHAADGVRSSALRFWSDDSKSLIRAGSGYWQYVPQVSGVRFLTVYDYNVRFGTAGRVFDQWVFRPMMGWATAWSFDRLRMWIEDGVRPEVSLRVAMAYTIARSSVALVWMYHGLVPKLIFRHPDELAMLGDSGVPAGRLRLIGLLLLGAAEVLFGLLVLVRWRSRWPLWLTVVAMPLATVGIAWLSPRFLISAFNALTLNLTTLALAFVALMLMDGSPSASRCARRPVEDCS